MTIMTARPNSVEITSEADMIAFGRSFAEKILAAANRSMVFELVGDVGAGKTTFTRGLAEGLGITEPVTSPSFTISKRYAFPLQNDETGQLIHYDFYRLDDPGIMRDELAETLAEPNSVVVVEWGGDVADLLPKDKTQLKIFLQEDGSRLIEITEPSTTLAKERAA